jgi:hypothetical protein
LNWPTDAIHSGLHFITPGAFPQRIRFWKSGRFFGFSGIKGQLNQRKGAKVQRRNQGRFLKLT